MSIMTRIADVDHAISALDSFLRGHDYTAESRRRIANHVREHRTLEGASPRHLDREHYQTATDIFVEALPAVPMTSDDWDDDGHWNLGPEDEYFGEWPVAPDDGLPDAPDHVVTTRPGYWAALAADGITRLPAISGGAPDDEPYEPSEEDRADYAAWSTSLDAMAFPAHEYSLADRKRWQRQNNLTDRSFAEPV
jgi:hypothetical protein